MRAKFMFAVVLTVLGVLSARDQSTELAQSTFTHYQQQNPNYDKAFGIVMDQLDAIRMGDSSKAYYAYTTKNFRKAVSLEDYKVMVNAFKPFSQNRTFLPSSTDTEGARVIKITGKLIATDNEMMLARFDMLFEDDEWKIQNIQLSQPILKGEQNTSTFPFRKE